MNLQSSWKHYFNNLETNEVSNKSLNVFSRATSITDDSTEETLIRSLTEDIDVVILTVAPVTGNIKIFHSPTNLGGTRIRPEHKLAALDGFGNNSTPVILDKTSMTAIVEIRTPSTNKMRMWTTIDEIKNSTTPNSGPKNFNHAAFSILPPFIANQIIEDDTRDPLNLFVNCKKLIEAHDQNHQNDQDYEKAAEHCRHLLTFLWAASKSLIPPTISITGIDDNEVTRWSSNRHSNCLITPTNDIENANNTNVNEDIIQSLAHSIDNQTLIFENIRQDKQEEKEEKKNKFSDLHDTTKLLIMNASSIDAESVPDDPVTSCKEFFNKKNISKAMDFMLTTLSQDLRCCVDIDTGLVTALYAGQFLRDRDDSPSIFSFFLTPKKLPLSLNRLKPTMILQLKANQGKGWSETDLKDALKQGIETPQDIHSFGHQLKNFWGLAHFFFGKDSILTQALEPLLATISHHTLTFEAAQLRDNMFATKLGYAIDTRVFRWLQKCRTHKTRCDVNDSLLNFDTIIEQVLTDSFVQSLPITFKNFKTTQHDDSDEDSTDTRRNSKKKRRRNNSYDTAKPKNVEVNPKTIATWLASDNEEYRRCFAAKNLRDRPVLRNRPLCQRYHSKGFCFDDCANKVTHVPSKDIEESIASTYKKYVDKCKSSK